MIDVKKLVSSYMENIKSFFKKSKNQTTSNTSVPTQPEEPVQEENSKQKQVNDYVIDWVASFVSVNNKLKGVNLNKSASDGQQFLSSRGIELIKKYAHLLPVWQQMGIIQYSGTNLEESVKTISSELYSDTYRNQTHTLYNEKTLAEYLAKKTEIEALFAGIDNEFMQEKLGTCISLLGEIESILARPHSTVPFQTNNETVPFTNSKDSGLIAVYINKINSISREIKDLLQYYNRAVEKQDTKTQEMIESRYGIKKFDFLDILKLKKSEQNLSYSELEDKYDKHKILTNIVSLLNNDNLLITTVFQPQNSEKLSKALSDIMNNVSEGEKTLGNDFFVDYVDIVNKHFAQNENFNNIFFKTTPPTMQEAEKLAQSTFDAVKEAIESSYLKVGIDLTLKFEEENLMPGQQEALGTFSKADDNRGVITIYRKQLKKIIEEIKASPIISAQIISTIFHETGHAIDDFWHEISKTQNTPSFLSELKNTLSTGALGPEDIYFISCVSPSFKKSVSKMIEEGKTLEDVAKMINQVEYYEMKEEHIARKTSKYACQFLFEQLAPYYQNDEIKSGTLNIIASSIDAISGTHYSYEDLERTDNVETLADAIKQDMSTVGTLTDIENLANDFDLSNFSNQQVKTLSEKASNIFKMYYSGLSKDKKQELVQTSIVEGRYPILEMVALNDLFRVGVPQFNPDDMIEYYRSVACRIKNGDSSKEYLMSTALSNLYDSSAFDENTIDYVFTQLASDQNLDEMHLLLDNFSFRKHFSPTKIYAYLTNIPAEQRTEHTYSSVLAAAKSILHRHSKQDGPDAELIEKIKQYIEEEQHNYYQNIRNKNEESTNMIAGSNIHLLN